MQHGAEAPDRRAAPGRKFPGVHIAFGDPYPRETGAGWSCPTHVDVVASGCTITVDGTRIMEDGVFLV
jgi:leucyl aminopeptidase (aminopeptidase T)